MTTVAIVDWTQLVEDYLDNIGVSFEAFCNDMSGGWLFGYIDALQTAGVGAVLMCVSARVTQTERFTHKATGATICVLPAPRLCRMFRRRVLNPYQQWSRVAPYLATPIVALARELRRQQCSAILCQDYEHGRFDVCVLLAKLMRLPVFATFQGGDTPGPFPRALAMRACDGLIVATRAEAARVMARYGLPESKIARVFNPCSEWNAGVPPAFPGSRAALGIPDGARVVAWHGRVDYHRKGLDVLLDAWDRICRDDRRLLLIGAGNESAALRERIARSRGVIWIDQYLNDRAALRRHLSAADVYAFPSRHEGFPVAPLEAMALQLPIVATDAVPDLLDEDSGLLVPCGDAAALATALARLLDDVELARTLGQCARRRIETHFSPAAVGAQLRDFMRLENRPGGLRRAGPAGSAGRPSLNARLSPKGSRLATARVSTNAAGRAGPPEAPRSVSSRGKVFGLGLSKTGTSSLTEALNLLGLRALHYPHDLAMAKDVDAMTDIPVAPRYAELDRAWPGSKFILSIREKTSWLRSIETHWRLMLQWWEDATPDMRRYHERVAMSAYGTLTFDREHFSRIYDAHERNVREYFRGRDDLLVMDICGGEGWPRLCPFLGLPEPRAPFPHANEWMHMLLQASAEIAEQVPPGDAMILVDEQGFGREFAGGRRAIPFLEREGQYWGAPPDGGTAIRELERLRGGGASFLAFGWPAFWWLDHYTELRDYIDTRFRCTLRNERLVVYDLREGLR